MRVLIAGGGEVAALIARRLIREGNQVVLVEENAERCARLDETLDAHIVQGNATSVRTLHLAGLADTDMLIAVTSNDEVNLLACMVAQAESKVKVKVARLRTHEAEHWRGICQRVGLHIDLIIHPESELVNRILPVLSVPGVSDIIDFAEGRVKLFGMNVDERSWVAGKSVVDLDRAGPPRNSLIAMIFRGQQVIIPHGEQVIQPDDHVYIVTAADSFEDVLEFMGLSRPMPPSRVFILGGKQLGIRVAEELEHQHVKVKLFEKDLKRCENMSHILRDSIIVHGDGTDEATLVEENIGDAGAFLAFTNDDEDNLIASLLARRLGVRKVVALINRLNYLSMAQRLGINTPVSPRLAAVDRILRFVRKGSVLSVTTFREEEAEAIELIAAPGSRYVGKKLRDVKLPREAIVGAIAKPNGEVIVPRGETAIEAGDRVIFFTLEKVVPRLESAFLAHRERERS